MMVIYNRDNNTGCNRDNFFLTLAEQKEKSTKNFKIFGHKALRFVDCFYLANIYLPKVNNGNTRTICEICPKLKHHFWL